MRHSLAEPIQQAALAWGVGVVDAQVIDEIGIAAATRLAMVQALAWYWAVAPDFLLIDWVKLPQTGLPQICVAKADRKMASVAAASILAKVTRDQLLVGLGEQYPTLWLWQRTRAMAQRNIWLRCRSMAHARTSPLLCTNGARDSLRDAEP